MNTAKALLAAGFFSSALCAFGCSGAPGDTIDATSDDTLASSGTAAPTIAQMNDMTIVYPLATSSSEFKKGYLAASSAGVGGALLPEALYQAAVPASKGPVGVGGTADMAYADLRLVAVRLDPCFANIGPVTNPAGCENQLRLVFQSLSFQGGQTSALDGAVHAFYSLTRAELVAAVQAIAALRKSTDLGPLAPHPLLVSQGITGAFGRGLEKIVLTYAGASKLTRFTHFMGANLSTEWTFEGFDVAKGKATPMVIPTLPGSATSVTFFAGFSAPIAGGFTPATTSDDDVSVLVNVDDANSATPALRQAAFNAALRIQNPGFESPNTIDCASCHVAQDAQVLMGQGQFNLSPAGNANAFAPDPNFVSAKDFAATTSPTAQSAGFNVHMISYKDDALFIGQRVINETAAIVTYMNQTVLAQPE
jgi:hypothetical protein